MVPALPHGLISWSLETSKRQIVASVTVRFSGSSSHDYHRGIGYRFFSEATALLDETDLGIAHFQDRKVQKRYADFIYCLDAFANHMAAYSTPERFGSVMLQSIIPPGVFDDMNISPQHREEIREANRLAALAWRAMIPLIAEIKERIPEVFDEKI
jgi:hypothetical protein